MSIWQNIQQVNLGVLNSFQKCEKYILYVIFLQLHDFFVHNLNFTVIFLLHCDPLCTYLEFLHAYSLFRNALKDNKDLLKLLKTSAEPWSNYSMLLVLSSSLAFRKTSKCFNPGLVLRKTSYKPFSRTYGWKETIVFLITSFRLQSLLCLKLFICYLFGFL